MGGLLWIYQPALTYKVAGRLGTQPSPVEARQGSPVGGEGPKYRKQSQRQAWDAGFFDKTNDNTGMKLIQVRKKQHATCVQARGRTTVPVVLYVRVAAPRSRAALCLPRCILRAGRLLPGRETAPPSSSPDFSGRFTSNEERAGRKGEGCGGAGTARRARDGGRRGHVTASGVCRGGGLLRAAARKRLAASKQQLRAHPHQLARAPAPATSSVAGTQPAWPSSPSAETQGKPARG